MTDDNEPTVGVVGGGPAGLIAAETLAVAGVSVVVYEHKRSVGRKFLLAGRGGLNITHAEPLDLLLARYGSARPRLEAAIRAFSPDDLRAWCAGHGEPTFVGTSERVFPESFRATPLLRSWLGRLSDLSVSIETGHRFVGWHDQGELLLKTDDGETVANHAATIFALGGASWPRVGSDGSWVASFEAADIGVETLTSANAGVHIAWTDVMRTRFEGTPIKNVVFSAGDRSVRGDAVITADGLEGGPIYALGPALRSATTSRLTLDLHPDLTPAALELRLSKRRSGASASSWLKSAGISPPSIALAREVTHNTIPDDPVELAQLLKTLPLPVVSLAPLDRAISTAGGVCFDDLDESFMVTSRPGTFVAGEMIDWEAPTGGYLLQACFSTGVAAANGALTWLDQQGAN